MGAQASAFTLLRLRAGGSKADHIEQELHLDHEHNRLMVKKVNIPVELQVAHFMPASFPLVPVVSEKRILKIQASWKIITEDNRTEGSGLVRSGITQFYDEFYSRLTIHDAMGLFETILVKHSAGKNTIAAKGAIILRIINFIFRLDFASSNIKDILQKLGRSHNKMGIRPWMYAAFVQTLLLTIASRLGNRATHDVMEAWVNVFAFVLKTMLPAAIRGLTQNDEMTMTSVIEQLTTSRENGGFYEQAKDRLFDRILRNSSSSSKKKVSLSEKYSGRRRINSGSEQRNSIKHRASLNKAQQRIAADQDDSESPSPSKRIPVARLPSGRYSIGGIKEVEEG